MYKKKAHTKQMARKSNKGLPKVTKGKKAGKVEKAVAVVLAVVEVEAVAVAVALVVVMEKETFRVDVSVNNWKIDLPLQPLSGKSHMCGCSRR